MVSEDIEVVVGGSIVSLALGTPYGGDGRETDEEIELEVPGEQMEDPGALELGSKDGLEGVESHLLE